MSSTARGTWHLAALLVGAGVAGACGKGGGSERGDSAAASAAAAPAAGAPAAGAPAAAGGGCAGDNAGLTLPAGFCATVFADSIGHARHLVVAANGDVYVTIDGTAPPAEARPSGAPPASFVVLRDANHDGRADSVVRVGKLGDTGIGIHAGHLYVDEGTRIVRYAMQPNELAPSGQPEVIVSGMPLEGHRARNFVIAGDGSLYVNVGSKTNSCQVNDRSTESPGHDPCTELATRAGIWRFDANRTGQTFAPSARFATGIRNAMGLTLDPTGRLWTTQHGRDQLHDNWPKVFPTSEYQAENPAEELMPVSRGDDFGWPYCYWSVDEKKLVDAPEYGGDGRKADRCASKKGAAATFPGHWAPMAALFYTGAMLPAKYRDGVFVTFHGSWNRAPLPQAGYRIVFQPMANGQAGGAYETFADGFAGLPADRIQPDRAKHRPVGLAQAPDGALFVSDDAGGRIYRITYRQP